MCFFPEFPTSALEMARVADEFDKGDGLIVSREFMNALRFDPKKMVILFKNPYITTFCLAYCKYVYCNSFILFSIALPLLKEIFWKP